MIECGTFGLVGSLAVNLKESLYLIEKRLLGLVIRCSEILSTLKHQMLEIVGKSGGFGGVVLSTHAHCYIRLYTRLILVYGHVDLKTVGKCVEFGFQRVVGYGSVLILRCMD